MRPTAILLAALALSPLTSGHGTGRIVAAHGVRVVVPTGWHAVEPTPSSIADPRTLLVVGTRGVRPNLAVVCQVAAYRVPARAAVVVVVGWRTATSGGGHEKPGRAPLQQLRSVKRPSFECFDGRGAAAQVTLRGKAYQVNVLVGDRASKRRVEDALAVARSFDVAR